MLFETGSTMGPKTETPTPRLKHGIIEMVRIQVHISSYEIYQCMQKNAKKSVESGQGKSKDARPQLL